MLFSVFCCAKKFKKGLTGSFYRMIGCFCTAKEPGGQGRC